jgi:hypothetical protein
VTAGEFAAIRSAGFLAVGRVLGAAVYDVVGVRGVTIRPGRRV